MNKTANDQLNQWETADPVRRADFNADNTKIDLKSSHPSWSNYSGVTVHYFLIK